MTMKRLTLLCPGKQAESREVASNLVDLWALAS